MVCSRKAGEAIEAAAPEHAENVWQLLFDSPTCGEVRLSGDFPAGIPGAVERNAR
jgi:hypothetical protein